MENCSNSNILMVLSCYELSFRAHLAVSKWTASPNLDFLLSKLIQLGPNISLRHWEVNWHYPIKLHDRSIYLHQIHISRSRTFSRRKGDTDTIVLNILKPIYEKLFGTHEIRMWQPPERGNERKHGRVSVWDLKVLDHSSNISNDTSKLGSVSHLKPPKTVRDMKIWTAQRSTFIGSCI